MDPITIALLGSLVFGGALYARSHQAAGGTPKPQCGGAAEQAAAEGVATSAASGAAMGSSVPGIGTVAGAGMGAAIAGTSALTSPCGQVWLGHWGQQIDSTAFHAIGQPVNDFTRQVQSGSGPGAVAVGLIFPPLAVAQQVGKAVGAGASAQVGGGSAGVSAHVGGTSASVKVGLSGGSFNVGGAHLGW